jgi:uncharacterized protein
VPEAQGYQVISGDSHLEIDSRRWIDRVPARYRDRAPRIVRLSDGGDAWLVEGQPLREVPTDLFGGKPLETYRPFGQNYETTAGTGPPEQRLHEQDVDGVDAEILFPCVSGPGMWRSIADDSAYRAVVRAYNDFLAEEYCAADPDRLIGLGLLPWTGVDDAIAEMEHCARIGLKGVHLGVFPSARGFPTPDDDRFWAAALDMNMPIAVHEELDRTGSRAGQLVDYPGVPRELRERIGVRRDLAQKMCMFAHYGSVNAVQMILDGVFDRFPRLRLFFAETQLAWIPMFMETADFRYQRLRFWAEDLLGQRKLSRLPSEYVREHCLWGTQWDRAGIEMRERIGVDRIIWATDFPHLDTEWPNSRAAIERVFAGVPEEEKHRMIAGNAVEFFGLERASA